jgi:hypothetical protein
MPAAYVYPKLAAARARARELGLPEPRSSQNPRHKLYVVYNGREIHFGARGYSDYLQHRDDDRRARYRIRHRAILLASGRPAYTDRNSPAYYSWHILW